MAVEPLWGHLGAWEGRNCTGTFRCNFDHSQGDRKQSEAAEGLQDALQMPSGNVKQVEAQQHTLTTAVLRSNWSRMEPILKPCSVVVHEIQQELQR